MNNKPQALILAAGDSKRLKKLTKDKPKSFLEIDNKKIIEHQLDKLSDFGIETVTIVVGFKSEMFKELLGHKYKNIIIEFVDCENYKEFNHSWSLYLSKDLLVKNNKDIIILHADTFYDHSIMAKLLNDKRTNLLLADSDFVTKTEDELLIYGQDEIVTGLYFSKEEERNPIGEFVGLHKMSLDTFNEFCNYLEVYFDKHGKTQGYDRIMSDFIKENEIAMNYLSLEIPWININYEEDYYYAKKLNRAFNNPKSLYQKRLGKLRALIQQKKLVKIKSKDLIL